MCENHQNNKRAISLENKEAHQKDHQTWSRRNFISTLGLFGGAGMALGGFSVNAMASSSSMPFFANNDINDRILVLIRLSGGNDGLNTFIPLYDYGYYSDRRPSIRWGQGDLINLNSEFGMPNVMQSLKPMWDDGKMKVISSVGYDNHNLSHFTSADIWNSGNQNIDLDLNKSGWLGRYILDENPNYLDELPETPGAIKISSGSSIAFNNPDQIDLAVNFNTVDRLLSVAESGFVYDTNNLPDDCYYGEQIQFLRSLLNTTYSYAPVISDAYYAGANDVQYASNELARQLALVARLIKGGLGTKLYMVTLGGFDTHENQNNSHPALLNAISDAVSNFYDDLAAANRDMDVLSVSYSEFGRRISENSGGTDHGTAAPMMLFGPALEGNGFLGANPDLRDTDNNGNLKHDVDFRSVYATILESWLCIDPIAVDLILGDTYDRLNNVGFDCLNVSSTNNTPLSQGVTHGVRQDGMGGNIVSYTLDRPGNIEVSIYSILGQKVTTLFSGYQNAGSHEHTYVNRYSGIVNAPMVYRITDGKKQYSGKFIVH